tara:strand:+ start:159 stop:680 length:522 start_codon:yes stop_codon:yes gene_type:complete
MKYIKNIILSMSILLIGTNIVSAQLPEIPTFKLNTEEVDVSDRVTMNKDITLKIGPLEIKAKFMFGKEAVPYNAYLIKYKDVKRLNDALVGCNSSCDILFTQVKKEYDNKLIQCQSDCDARIKLVSDSNDELKIEKKSLEDKVSSEITAKYIWSALSAAGGAGLGILIYSIAN